LSSEGLELYWQVGRMFAWSAPPDPKEQVKKWKQNMRGEMRKVDRQIGKIEREEQKVKQSIKQAAKRGDTGSAKQLAKEVVRSRRAVSRLHTSKAQMNSVVMQMQNQLAQQKVMGHLTKSADVMKAMNRLVKVGEISETMQQMQKEMCKAGVIEEMVDDAFDALDGEEDEDAADEEVDRVMQELNVEAMGGAQAAPTTRVQAAQAVEEEEEEDLDTMCARLEQLKQ